MSLSNPDGLVDSRNGLVATRRESIVLAVSGKCSKSDAIDWSILLTKHDAWSTLDLDGCATFICLLVAEEYASHVDMQTLFAMCLRFVQDMEI